MRQAILSILICITFIWTAGCMEPREYSDPLLEKVTTERQALKEQAVIITEKIDAHKQTLKCFQQSEIEFMRRLTVEELVAYERLSSTPIDNMPQIALNQRLLLDLLSEENTTSYWQICKLGYPFHGL